MGEAFAFIIKIKGGKELLAKLQDPRLIGKPVREMFKLSTRVLQKRIVPKTPVDQGTLKGSIDTEVDRGVLPKWGRVFTNVKHAPFVEWNTKPHWPPWGPGSALSGWAGRKGIKPFLVARAISIRGTKGKHMFANALKDSAHDLRRIQMRMARAIEAIWSKT